MNKNAAAPRPKKKLGWRILKVLLWTIGGLVALILVLIATLASSQSFREWTATLLMSDTVVRNQLASVPQRSEPLPVQKLMVRMRDGVELSTQVYLPKGAGPWPVIVVRDPYSFVQYGSCKVFVRYGYGCVYQEVRGRGPSQGTWYPFVDERKDGLDLIDWILKQPWQNGKLALYGGSYLGAVQWAVSGDMPPEVKTFAPTVAHGDVYELAYRNGAFNEGVTGTWMHSQGKSIIDTVMSGPQWRKKVAGHFPAQGVPSDEFVLGWKPYLDYIKHPDRDDTYWQSPEYVALREAHLKVKVPVLMTGFANDFFLPGMLRTYEELPTRSQSVFLIGPGNHGGQEDPEVQGSYKDGYVDTLAWFDHYLRGEPLPARLRPGVTVFVHGANSWQHFERWPTAAVQPRLLQLGNLSASQACDGGSLSAEAPAAAQSISYVYDPRKPVPSRGGAFILLSDAVEEQHNDLCERGDVLSFSSAPVTGQTLIDGGIRVTLRVASDAADTTFTVRLSEHMPDGKVYNIRDDISTLSMRNKAPHRGTYKPGEQVDVVFDLTPILWKMREGSRLRLDVSSSSAPSFFPHPNRAGLWSAVAEPVVAKQTVFGGVIELPLR